MRVPRFLYGTAWNEHRTEGLTRLALEVGFRGIDTANQRQHYFEAGVGAAIAAARIARDELFLQTEFTDVRGQDHRLPYDPDAPPFSSELIWRQVEQSFASSLKHLGVDHVDSYVLHGPESGRGWSAADREVWGAMERLHRERRARLLGVSNISRDQLVTLCGSATVAPALGCSMAAMIFKVPLHWGHCLMRISNTRLRKPSLSPFGPALAVDASRNPTNGAVHTAFVTHDTIATTIHPSTW